MIQQRDAEEPEFNELRLDVDGSVARLTLARVGRNNLLSPRLLEELTVAAAWLDGERGVKVVVVDGEGAHFCSGSEVRAFQETPPRRDVGRLMVEAISDMGPLTIARLHGHVRGAGAVLALACDLRFAVTGTRFSLPEARFGWPLNWGGIPRLVREVGPMLAKDLVVNSRPLSAQGMVAAGLALFAGDEAEVDEVIADTLDNLHATPAAVIRVVKSYITACAESMVPAAAGREDNVRLRAVSTDPEATEAASAAFAQLKATDSVGSRLLLD